MREQKRKKSVVCFGEVLWDNLPTGRKAGGAPMNVAYHLRRLGVDASIISRVGADGPGTELLDVLKQIDLSTGLIQIGQADQTSEVIARIDEGNEVAYDILCPVAWDFIDWQPSYRELLRRADAFVFGSLAARNERSRTTLFGMLGYTAFNVFDVNLRAPHYDCRVIEQLLYKTDLLKLNEAELMALARWFSCRPQESEIVSFIQEKIGINEIIVTKGSRGASFYHWTLRYDYPVYPVKVADTVGSGDAFLAAFLAKRLEGEPVEIALDYAAALSALVTGEYGACPSYRYEDVEGLIRRGRSS